MTVSDIAREDVVTVTPETPVEELAREMRTEQVGSLVVAEDGAVVGIVTDRDLGLDVWTHDRPTEVTAADLMTEDPVTVDEDAGVYDALERAQEASVRRLPVVSDGELAGIITLDDFVVLLSGEFDAVSEIVQGESPPY